MRAWTTTGILVLLLACGACRSTDDSGCGTCTATPGALCDDGTCRPRLGQRPDPTIEVRHHNVASLPFESVAAWPVENAVAGHFVGSLLSGAGIPHKGTGLGAWQDVGVPEPLAPRARRLLEKTIQAGQPGRSSHGAIPTDAPAHLAFKVLERR